ncbi:hypothetical protein YC2023_012434 [Brassica napus]
MKKRVMIRLLQRKLSRGERAVLVLEETKWGEKAPRLEENHPLDHYILPLKKKDTALNSFKKPAAGTKDRRDMLDQLHQHPRGAYSQHGLFNNQELRS